MSDESLNIHQRWYVYRPDLEQPPHISFDSPDDPDCVRIDVDEMLYMIEERTDKFDPELAEAAITTLAENIDKANHFDALVKMTKRLVTIVAERHGPDRPIQCDSCETLAEAMALLGAYDD